MFEDLIEALFNVDVDVRPSVKPEVNSFELGGVVGVLAEFNPLNTSIQIS